jgi:hypothetical protein
MGHPQIPQRLMKARLTFTLHKVPVSERAWLPGPKNPKSHHGKSDLVTMALWSFIAMLNSALICLVIVKYQFHFILVGSARMELDQ